jgi:hypothetical protein
MLLTRVGRYTYTMNGRLEKYRLGYTITSIHNLELDL